jgi:hypothetical protein
MVSYTAQYMADCIAKCGLELHGKPGGDALLVNGRCTIRFGNVDNDFVSFQFWNPANEVEIYSFANYLDCAYDHRGLELSPNMPRDIPAEEQFVGCLKNYDRLLCEGYFDAPLSGDFSWVPAYHAMLAEEERLSIARLDLEDAGHPEAEAILKKEIAGDPTWMDDVRRILAEQEPKP